MVMFASERPCMADAADGLAVAEYVVASKSMVCI